MWRGGFVLWRCGGGRGGRVDFLVQMENCLVCRVQCAVCVCSRSSMKCARQLSGGNRGCSCSAAYSGGRERGNLVAAESSFHDNHYFK